jgi:hypothetical protein
MKSIELLEKYPLSTEVIRQWFFNEMMKSIEIAEDVPEEFIQAMIKEGVSDERLSALIDAQPRGLFDVFDENDICINIERSANKIVEWSWEISPGHTENSVCKSRKEAELFAIEAAFEILEQRLNN